jgi:pyruvate/2-oxoglutarate dehydrogenase complex dihydrolipoamide acyltransferase (E2) component
MNPLIYGHQGCHASIGSQRTVPVFNSGKISKREVVDVTMGCDHRVLDGATVARFTSAWRDYSESPTLALLSMI